MVLNQCMVKGCHSSSSTDSLEVGSSGGHLQPVPKEVIENVAIEKKWIELIKGNRTLTSRQGNIRSQYICEKHFEESDFIEGKASAASKKNKVASTARRSLKPSAMPRKCLPNQGGHQDENDYIYYDRESVDKGAARVMETRDNSTELGGESIIEKNNKELMEVTEAGNPDDATSKTTHLKSTTTDSNNDTGEPATSTLLKEKGDNPEEMSIASEKNATASTGSTLSITKSSSPAKASLESRVKTVVARDKATGKKVLMRLMPVGSGLTKSLSPSKGATAAVLKTINTPNTNLKTNMSNRGAMKRPYNFISGKSTGQNRSGHLMALNSRLLLRPSHELASHPNNSFPPNAAHQAAAQVRQKFNISTTNTKKSPSGARITLNQQTEPTPLKNLSHLYNELGLSNIVSGTNDLEKKSKGDEEKNLLRHVDSVIETIMEETRLSEGEGELSKVLRSGKSAATSSQQGDEAPLEFPDGEVPQEAIALASSSTTQQSDDKSRSPVRFTKSLDGTIKISSVLSNNANAKNLQPQLERKITMTPKGPLLMRRELGAQGPILIRKGTESNDKNEIETKISNETDQNEESVRIITDAGPDNSAKAEVSPMTLTKQMSFSNRIVMNQLENPRELANLPNLTTLPKYQLETASKITGGAGLDASEVGTDSTIGQLESEAKRHQQIHLLIKLARLWMNKANDLEVVNARLAAGWKDAGLSPGYLEVTTDKALVYWRHKAMTLNAENLTLKKELVAFIRSKGDISDETAKRYRTDNANLRSKLAAKERQYKKTEKVQAKQKETVTKLRKDLSAEIKERGALLRRKRNRDRRVEVNAARRRWRAQVMKELVNQNKLHPDVLKRPRIFYPPYIGQKYVDAEGNPLPKPKPFANWNKKKGVESGKLVEDIRDLPPEAFQQNQQLQQQFILSSPHKLISKDSMDGEVLLAKSETDIAVASITAAGLVQGGVVTIGNQQITVEGAPSDGQFGSVVNITDSGQMPSHAQFQVNQLNEELLRGGELSNNLKSAVQDAIQRMESGNYSGNNVKNRPYRWQGKGPRPPHKQPPPKKNKKMNTLMDGDTVTTIEVDGDNKFVRGKMRGKGGKPKTPKMAYSTTLKKVDTRNVSNNVVNTTTSSLHNRAVQGSDLAQHSYINTTVQQQHPTMIRKTKRKRGGGKSSLTRGASDEELVGDSDDDDYGGHSEQVSQQQQHVFQQIVPQHVVQEVIGTNQTSSNMEGVGLVGAGLNLMPQIGQVQYIQETENGQIIHYQLHDQYGQILQQDQGQTQVIVTTQEGVPQEVPYQHIVTTTQQDTTNTDGIYTVPLGDATTASSGGSSINANDAQQITQTVLRQNDGGDVLMSFSVPYKVETTSNVGSRNTTSSENNEWQTTTVTTVVPPDDSPQQ